MKNNKILVLVLKVSKVKIETGLYYLKIEPNLKHPSYIFNIPLPSDKVKPRSSGDAKILEKKIKEILVEIFKIASRTIDSPSVTHKCIFSDRYVSGGRSVSLPINKGETDKEIIVPMNENECMFFFECIPRGF